MSFFKSSLSTLLIIINALALGYFSLKITGRHLPTDFIRPFIIGILGWSAVYLLIRARWHKSALIWTLILSVFSVSTAVSYVYYTSIDSFFTGDDIVAIAQSNIEELYDFAEHYLINENTLLYGALSLAAALLTLVFLYFRAAGKKIVYKNTAVFFAFIFIIASVIITTQLRPFKYYRLMVSDLQSKIDTFHALTQKLESASVSNAYKSKKGELYVLVIGESLCRDNMGLYNRSIDNTPFLSRLGSLDNTVVFNNAYSSFVNTVPSITASFSQGNFVTGLIFPEGENLISMAKKSGMVTHWISNQVKNGNADTPVGAISSLADNSFFTTNYVFDGSYSQKPDKVLLPQLKKVFDSLDSSQNNFVIVHIMGNHSPYYNRFPENYPVIKINDASQLGSLSLDANVVNMALDTATAYDNYVTAVKYNDEFLNELYDLFATREDYRAFIYYSDHAEAIHYDAVGKAVQNNAHVGRHNVAQFSYAMSRIPFIVNVSDSFVKEYPSSFYAMERNKNKIVTNDTLYDFMLDLMQIKSSAVNYKLSAANMSFDMGNEQDITIIKDTKVANDPEYIANITALDPLVKRIAIRSANSLFKANSLISKGYETLHVDTITHDGKIFVRALKDYDDDFIGAKEYMHKLYNKDSRVIFALDDKAEISMLEDLLSYKNVALMASSLSQYEKLKAAGFANVILKLADYDESAIEKADKICIDEAVFKKHEAIFTDLIKPAAAVNKSVETATDGSADGNTDKGVNEYSADDVSSRLVYIIFDELSVQDRQSVLQMHSMSDKLNFIVNYDNAFSSDF